MSTEVVAAPPEAAQTKSGDTPAGGAQNQPNIQEMLTGFSKRLDSVFAEVRRIKDGKTETPANPEKPGSIQEQLEALRTEVRAEKEAVLKERKESAILNAISSFGIDEEYSDLLFDHLMTRHGEKITVVGKQVVYEDTEDGKISVKDFVGKYLKDKGDKFKPARTVPTGGFKTASVSNGQKRYSEMSMDERLKLTPAQEAALARSEMGN